MKPENAFDGEWLDEIMAGFGPEKKHQLSRVDEIDDSWLPEQISNNEMVKVQTALFYVSSHYFTIESLNYNDIDIAATRMLRTLARFIEKATFQITTKEEVFVRKVGEFFPDYSVHDVYFGLLWQRKLLKRELPQRIEGTLRYDNLKIEIENCTSIAKIAERAIELDNERKGLTS